MNTTDAVVQRRDVPISIIHKNFAIIRSLNFDHLDFIEKYLDYYEKVSLMFLLCAADRKQRAFFLEELIALSSEQSKQTNYLRTWAKSQDKWKDILLEALCLIQAKRIIFELGLDFDDLIGQYLPSNSYVSDNIHAIVKLLYHMCEEMTVQECRCLVDCMQKKNPKLEQFKYSDAGKHLEMHLMHWISEHVIELGAQSNDFNGFLPCNLQPLIQFFKQYEMDELKEIISNVSNKFNGTSIPKMEATIMPSNRSQTDDKQAKTFDEASISLQQITLHNENNQNEGKYTIRSESAGILLIINQEKFHREKNPLLQHCLPDQNLDTRHGTDKDEIRLTQVFAAMNFKVLRRSDLTHRQILTEIDDVVNESEPYDSVFICILSHGYEGVVYGANSIPVKIERIKERMVSINLTGKPKVLIIQACQGQRTQIALPVNQLATDGNIKSKRPAYCDLLTCVSSVKRFTSIRNKIEGSWFIQTLCQKIIELADQKHFLDILTIVNGEVQNMCGPNGECMAPEFSSSLGRLLYLPAIKRQ